MNLISYLYRQSWRLLALATFCGVVSGLCGAGVVGLINKGVTGGMELWLSGLLFFGLCIVQLATKSFSEIALLRSTQDAIYSMRMDLSRKLLATPQKRLQELGKPGLLVILTKDVDTFVAAFQMLPTAFGDMIVIVACLAYMAWLSMQMFVIFTICLFVCVIGYHILELIPMQKLARVREQMDVLYENFRGLIEGSKELQLNAQRGTRFVDGVVGKSAEDFRDLFVTSMSSFVWVVNSGALMFYFVIGLVLFIVPHWYPQTPATMMTATLILLYLIRPITEMTMMAPGLHQAGIALSKIQQLEGDLELIEAQAKHANPFARSGALRLEMQGVCHQYPAATEDGQFMLGPIDLTIHQGETVFIVGGNGSGKTTLAMLLLGLYHPESGRMLLNGEPVTTDNVHAYRQYFSAVFADFYLFEQLLDADQAEIAQRAQEYIEKLRMSHKVKVEDGKFSTINLSTGQRKRLALVSSYLEDRPIYLFDEWAADQDPVFKRVFYTELLPELKSRGKTVLIITHDDHYFDYADRIVKLEDGKIHHDESTAIHTQAPLQLAQIGEEILA